MENGYEVLWTDSALLELENVFIYLDENWTEREIQILAYEIELTIDLISKNPYLFQKSDAKLNVRRAVILKFNSLYYKLNKDQIEILSFFLNHKSPSKLNIK
jgi:plasmid stabilization system protein ParE